MQTEAVAVEEPKASAELAAMPTREMQQLAKRYAAAAHGVALEGAWRDGLTRLDKLAESLRVRRGGGGVALRRGCLVWRVWVGGVG